MTHAIEILSTGTEDALQRVCCNAVVANSGIDLCVDWNGEQQNIAVHPGWAEQPKVIWQTCRNADTGNRTTMMTIAASYVGDEVALRIHRGPECRTCPFEVCYAPISWASDIDESHYVTENSLGDQWTPSMRIHDVHQITLTLQAAKAYRVLIKLDHPTMTDHSQTEEIIVRTDRAGPH